MRIRSRSDRRVAHGSRIKGKQSLRAQFQIVECCELHEQVVGMLSVGDGEAERGLTLLEKERVLPSRDGRRFQAKHGSNGEDASPESALSHRHQPVR